MIKKPLLIFCLSMLLAVNASAQQDSTFRKTIAIKFNLLGLFAAGVEYPSEVSLMVEIPIIKQFHISIGGGPCISVNGIGYTARMVGSYFFNPKEYISLQFFYRNWILSNVYFYQSGGSEDVADEYLTNADDDIINPKSSYSSPKTNNQFHQIPNYTVDNANVNVYAFDFVYGKQTYIGHSKHMIFEKYFGFGVRRKNIALQQTSYQWDNNTYASSKTLSYNTWVGPDLKLGFMIGYKF